LNHFCKFINISQNGKFIYVINKNGEIIRIFFNENSNKKNINDKI